MTAGASALAATAGGSLMPLAILNHIKPTRHLPAELHLHELYPAGLEHTDLSLPRNEKFLSLGNG